MSDTERDEDPLSAQPIFDPQSIPHDPAFVDISARGGAVDAGQLRHHVIHYHEIGIVLLALADYARARRAAGVQPETMLVEFKRLLRRAIRGDVTPPRLTGRLIELYFAS